MKYIILLFLIVPNINFSQNIEKIKAQNDVLFVLSDGYNGNFHSKSRIEENSDNAEKDEFWYTYYFKGGNSIVLSYREYDDFDEMEKDNPAFFVKVKKSFLRKNKDIIITKEFMRKVGYKKSDKIFTNAKTIIMIDKSQITHNRIILKKVTLINLNIIE